METKYEGPYTFAHERLDVFRVAKEVARWAAKQVLPPSRKHLADQLVRAADSMVLNIGEGCGHEPGAARRNHFRIALGSAAEVHAVLELVDLPEGDSRKQELRRVGAMLARMCRM
ncbi:MAG: four helix bundle protein [Myxococcota bacterium]